MRFAATALILLAATISTHAAAGVDTGHPESSAAPESSATASATTAATVAPEAEEKKKKKKKVKKAKKICRTISDMGSRRSTRKCMTQKEWERFNNGN